MFLSFNRAVVFKLFHFVEQLNVVLLYVEHLKMYLL
jgi:hypothetical protein